MEELPDAPGSSSLPSGAAPAQAELFARLGDAAHMLTVFRRVLPAVADGAEIRVTGCRANPSKTRKAARDGRLKIVYELDVEVGGEPREYVLLGVAPAPPELAGELEQRRRRLRGHPWAAPFRELATHVEELQLALLFFPLDPALPGLAEVTGREGAGLFADFLPECRAGVEISGIECDLVHYKPLKRAVLRVRATLRGSAVPRTVYAKVFADDEGAEQFRNLAALWSVARSSTCLRIPEPLGYDAERRMLVMNEARGGRDMLEWGKCIEQGLALPAGVDAERLERCALVAARALRELQGAELRPELVRSFAHELAGLKKDCDLLLGDVRRSEPELAARVEALLARLSSLAPAEERLVPAHGAYRHDQMIGDEHAMTVLDWDGLCLANPALDAAEFLGRIAREPVRRPGSAPELERMGAAFRGAFLEGQPALERDLDLYLGLGLTEQILRAIRLPGAWQEKAHELRNLAAAAARALDRVD